MVVEWWWSGGRGGGGGGGVVVVGRILSRHLPKYHLQATIQDQIQSQRES